MFQDIVQLTHLTLINALEDKTISLDIKALYDAYRKMDSAIYAMHVLEVHYLSIPFESHFLQNSQHGTPFQKWCYVVEGDLDSLRKKMRAFLEKLVQVRYKKCHEEISDPSMSIVEKLVRAKYIFGFFSHFYESGKLSNDGQNIILTKLSFDKNSFYEEVSIDIDTYEKRVALCEAIHISVEEMTHMRDITKSFLLTHASVEDLL